MSNKSTADKRNKSHTSRRHRFVFSLLRPFFRLYLRIKYNYKAVNFRPINVKGPFFILASHTGAWDPFMLAMSFKEPIYFVASDHIFRLGLVSRLIRYLVAPIPIVKSQIDLQAMRQIISINREGGSICLFPSGNRSFAGPELPIPEATGKLIRHMKCSVLFYRFEGGYLTTPRWARFERRGKLSGKVVQALSAQDVAKMTPDELNSLAADLLQANPYQTNKSAGSKYKGRRLAEHLERVLFICPQCHSISSLVSHDNILRCGNCDFAAEYLENGWFQAYNVHSREIINKFPHTAAFDSFQRDWLEQKLAEPDSRLKFTSSPIFTDRNEKLIKTARASQNTLEISGTLKLYSDRLVIENADGRSRIFSLCSLGRLSVHGPQVLQLHDHETDNVYELKSDKPRSAYKYLIAVELLKKYCKKIGEEVG